MTSTFRRMPRSLMIRTTCRRVATVAGAAVLFAVTGVPLFTGTALAASVSASPDSAPNNGPVTVTLTGSAQMFTATKATLINHANPNVTIETTDLSTASAAHPTQRAATFQLLNKLPGLYDITVTEAAGSDTCSSCFTIVGLPPSLALTTPTSVVTGSTAPGSITLTNPARGYDYPNTRIKLEMSGVANLHANQMTLTADLTGTPTPVTLTESAGSIIGFVGPTVGTHVAPNQSVTIHLVFGVVSGAPTGLLGISAVFGDVNTSTGALVDSLATDDGDTKITATAAGSTYHAMTPVRVLDTRNNTGHSGPLLPRGTLTLAIGGTHGVSAEATAVAINITATGGTSHGFLLAYPSDATKPSASNVNYPQGGSAANLAVVPLSASTHALTISNESSAATVHVVGDVVGYYATSGSVYHPLSPARILDTRTGAGTPIAAGSTRTLTVANTGGVPASGASAVAINITATRGQVHGFLRVFPTGTSEPSTSNVNFDANQTIANLSLAQLSSDGRITISNHSGGTVHVIVDVQGYFSSGSASSLHPLTITRVLDTRTTGSGQPLAGNTAMTISLGGKGGLPASGITMAAVNLTVTQPVAGGHITAYSANDARPSTSNDNFATGQTIANLAYVKVSDSGGLTIYNGSSQPIHLIVDVEGWGSSP
jgi:hypothetical protein